MVDVYRTRQLPQAAFLLACDCTFLRCEPTGGRFVDLVFCDTDGMASRFAAQFYDNATCPALKYYKAITEVRRMISGAVGTLQGGHRG